MIECRWMSVGIHTNSLFSWYNIQSLYRNLASGWWVSWKIIRYLWWLVMFFSSSAASLTWSFERRFINPNSLRYSLTNIYSVLIPICVKFDSYVDTYRWRWFWVFMLCLLGNTPMMSVGIHSQPAIWMMMMCVLLLPRVWHNRSRELVTTTHSDTDSYQLNLIPTWKHTVNVGVLVLSCFWCPVPCGDSD